MCCLPSKGTVWLGTPRNIIVMDKEKMTQKMILEGHTDVIHAIIRVGSELWTASSDKTIRVWNDEGDLLQSLIGHTSRVFDLAPLGIEYLWSVSWDKSIFVWHAQVCHLLLYHIVLSLYAEPLLCHRDEAGTSRCNCGRCFDRGERIR